MSHANADQRDPAHSLDEWRVDVDEPADHAPDPVDSVGDWSRGEVTRRRERVSAELDGWRQDLAERIRLLEQRLDRARE